MRSHYSSEITGDLEGKEVSLAGWIHEVRDLGRLKFMVLRDREGFIQVTGKKTHAPKTSSRRSVPFPVSPSSK